MKVEAIVLQECLGPVVPEIAGIGDSNDLMKLESSRERILGKQAGVGGVRGGKEASRLGTGRSRTE